MKNQVKQFQIILVLLLSLVGLTACDKDSTERGSFEKDKVEVRAKEGAHAQLCKDYAAWCESKFQPYVGLCDPQGCVDEKVNVLACLNVFNMCMPNAEHCATQYMALMACQAGGKPFCGDGKIDPGEQCDDGKPFPTGGCPLCHKAKCGDKRVQTGVELCDDGNNIDGDGCSAKCMTEKGVCGDDIVNVSELGLEECDPIFNVNDSCGPTCQWKSLVDWSELILNACHWFIEDYGSAVWNAEGQEFKCNLADPCFTHEDDLASCLNWYGVCALGVDCPDKTEKICSPLADRLLACQGEHTCKNEQDLTPQ